MQVNSLTNYNTKKNYSNQKQAFGMYYRLSATKDYFPVGWGEEKIENYFKESFETARVNVQGRIGKFLSNMIGNPPLGFMHYPGYEYLARYIREDGPQWVSQKILKKYPGNYDYNPKYPQFPYFYLPKTNRDNIKFTVFTDKNSIRFRESREDHLSRISVPDKVKLIEELSGTKVTPEDIKFVEAVLKYKRIRAASTDATLGVKVFNVQLSPGKDLTETLSDCFLFKG